MSAGSSREEIRSLTGLRGVAALLVVIVHTAAGNPNPLSFWQVFSWHGYLWVDLFLLLSGFILLRTYDDLFLAQPFRQAYPDFLARRLARIWPLFAAVTVFELAARQHGLTWYPDPLTPWRWPLVTNLLMAQAWLGQPSIDLPGWSISGEWACCLLFPLFRRLTSSGRGGPVLLFYLAGFAALSVLAISPIPVRHGALDLALPETPFPVFRCIASFAMGMALWRLSDHPVARRVAAFPFLDVEISVAIFILLGFRHTDLLVVALFAPLILCLTRQKGMVSHALANGPLYWSGLVSYSIYLLQVPLVVLKGQSALIAGVERLLAPFGVSSSNELWLALFYVLLLGCSAATWILIEQPCRRGLRRVLTAAHRPHGLRTRLSLAGQLDVQEDRMR